MVKKAKSSEASEVIEVTERPSIPIENLSYLPDKNFTGVVYTLCYRPHNGFANYAIATITIIEGKVDSISFSQPYAGFEAFAFMQRKNEQLLEKMRSNYPPGFEHAV